MKEVGIGRRDMGKRWALEGGTWEKGEHWKEGHGKRWTLEGGTWEKGGHGKEGHGEGSPWG